MTTVQTPTLAGLIERAAKFTSYSTYAYSTDRNIPGVQGRATVAEATELVRVHVAADGRLRNTEVTNHGAVIVHQGDRHVRLEPGLDARPQKLTKRQAEDVRLISLTPDARLVHEPGKGWTVQGGFTRIPPAATETLISHGWIATDGADGSPVRVSVAGLVALTWHYLKTSGAPTAHIGEEIAESIVDTLSE